MAGLPTTRVLLDDGTGSFPFNITSEVRAWSLSRGRSDEMSDIDPSQLSLTLDNNAGHFTFGAGPYSCFVDQQVRVVETFGSTASTRFTGYVQEWPTSWDDGTGNTSTIIVSASDRLARFQRRELPSNGLTAAQQADAATAIYPMAEAAGATGSGDASGHQHRALRVAGSGTAPVWGSPLTGLPQTGVQFASPGGQYLSYIATDNLGTIATLSVGFQFSAACDMTLAQIATGDPQTSVSIALLNTGAVVTQSVVGGTTTGTSSPVLASGVPHVATFVFNSTTFAAYVDGVSLGSFAPAATPTSPFQMIYVGQSLGSIAGSATIFNVAMFPTALSATQVAAEYAALGLTPNEASDVRVARLASYAGVQASNLALESGVLTSTAMQDVDGVKVLDSMQDVVTAEGGVLFVRGDGKLVMQNRYHRTTTSTSTPHSSLVGDDIGQDAEVTVDKQYLQNYVTATSATSGVQALATNAASLAQYDQYPEDLGTLLVTTDAETYDRAAWEANEYSQPLPRCSSVEIDLLSLDNPSKVASLLSLELGDRITITSLPSQSPVTTLDLLVEGIDESQDANTWSISFNTVPSALSQAWILGDSTFGVLDSTTRLHY